MKKLISFLSISLFSMTGPLMAECMCKDCKCTADNHCGCFTKPVSMISPQACPCDDEDCEHDDDEDE